MTRPLRQIDLPPRPFRAVTLIEGRDAGFHGSAVIPNTLQGRHHNRPASQSCLARQGGQASLTVIL